MCGAASSWPWPVARSPVTGRSLWSPDVGRLGRLRTVLEVYGELERADLLPEIAVARLAEMVGWIRARAERGDPSVAVHVKENHIGIYESDMAWIRANAGQLRATSPDKALRVRCCG
jgi:hypothetical protein